MQANAANDPNGFYARLGVPPAATVDEIKAAYRNLAKRFHPDVDKSDGAHVRFQAISEAYLVLSDPERRNAYDATRYSTASRANNNVNDLQPICCSRCGKITAQPRSIVFYRVTSFLVITTRTPIQGLFCSVCAKSAALNASLVSAIFGWWGFPWGPIWTISSIFKNANGGKYSEAVEEQLLWYNSLAFLSKGKLAIAYALAQQLRRAASDEIAMKASKLVEHLQLAGVPANSPRLKDPWSSNLFSKVAHSSLTIALPAAIAILVFKEDASKRTSSAAGGTTSAIVRYSVPPQQPLPERAQAKELGNNTPSQIAQCEIPPANGAVFAKNFSSNTKGHTLEIRNGSNGHAIVKIRDANVGRLVASFFVSKGGSASMENLPDGRYRIQYAFGQGLGADCRNFAQITHAAQFPDTEELNTRYTSTEIIRSRLSYTLFSVLSGNVRPQTLDLRNFNAD